MRGGTHPSWTSEEDARIIQLLSNPTGSNESLFEKLAKKFRNRSANAISSRWYTVLSPAAIKRKQQAKPKDKAKPLAKVTSPKVETLTTGAKLMQTVLQSAITATQITITNTELIITF